MRLIGRLFAIAFGFLAACLVAFATVVFGLLLSMDITYAFFSYNREEILLHIGLFIFVSGLALLPMLIVVAITESFSIRSVLAYAIGGGVVGLVCYLSLMQFDVEAWRFDGIVRRHLEVAIGAGIVGGLIYWMIAGRNAGGWRTPHGEEARLQRRLEP